jgi:diacylglycerol kinase (ATP)
MARSPRAAPSRKKRPAQPEAYAPLAVRLLFIVNPKSGRGKATPLADSFDAALRDAGHSIERSIVAGSPAEPWRADLASFDACVVFGGYGTVHNLLPALINAPAALYHVPMGTENLFARHFGMDRRPETLRSALESRRIATVDLGEANGRPFAIMCSAGPDAAVVRRLAAGRTGAIRHSSYIAPIVAEVFNPSLGPITIEADGREILSNRRGALIIGNSPMYALGLNPARDADMTDGLLDVVFMPASSSLALGRWACAAAFGSPLRSRNIVFHRARDVVVRAEAPTSYQLDGDEGGVAGNGTGALRVCIRPGSVRVLIAGQK